MKGLFIKDFSYIKQSKFLFLILIAFGFIFSYFYDMNSFVFGYFSVFPSIMLMGTLNYDDYNHGLTAIFSLPITKKQYIKEKYQLGMILGLVFLLLALIISSITQLNDTGINQIWNTNLLYTSIIVLMFYYLFIAICTPVTIYFGGQKNQQAMLSIMGGIFLVCFITYFSLKLLGIDIEIIIDHLASSLLITSFTITILLIIIYYLSYRISIKVINNKEY